MRKMKKKMNSIMKFATGGKFQKYIDCMRKK